MGDYAKNEGRKVKKWGKEVKCHITFGTFFTQRYLYYRDVNKQLLELVELKLELRLTRYHYTLTIKMC